MTLPRLAAVIAFVWLQLVLDQRPYNILTNAHRNIIHEIYCINKISALNQIFGDLLKMLLARF